MLETLLSSALNDPDPALDSLISDLILRVQRRTTHWQHAREWATVQLGMSAEFENQADLTVRLRVALSLCPIDALTHRRSDRVSRVEKIRRYIVSEELVPDNLAVQLAQAVDQTLDTWQVQRVNVAAFRSRLLERDGSKCNSCHVDLDQPVDQVETVQTRDPYKLAWVNPERNFEATVDHREPVSKFGTNELDNLWLLCRFCNEGKGDDSPLLLKHELKFAVDLPWKGTDVPGDDVFAHSSRLAYRVLARQEFRCRYCDSQNRELTFRKERSSGLAVLSNLVSICVRCSKDA